MGTWVRGHRRTPRDGDVDGGDMGMAKDEDMGTWMGRRGGG